MEEINNGDREMPPKQKPYTPAQPPMQPMQPPMPPVQPPIMQPTYPSPMCPPVMQQPWCPYIQPMQPMPQPIYSPWQQMPMEQQPMYQQPMYQEPMELQPMQPMMNYECPYLLYGWCPLMQQQVQVPMMSDNPWCYDQAIYSGGMQPIY